MKRDLETIRDLLFWIEDNSSYGNFINVEDINIKNCPTDKLLYHIELLHDAGFIDGFCHPSRPNQKLFSRLTFAGCEYLDSIRDPKIWSQTKEKISMLGESVTMEIVQAVATKIIFSVLGLG